VWQRLTIYNVNAEAAFHFFLATATAPQHDYFTGSQSVISRTISTSEMKLDLLLT
jgi:hypothetical protein